MSQYQGPQDPNNPPQGQPQPGQPHPLQGQPGQPYPPQHGGATTFAPQQPPKKKRVWLWVLLGVLALFLVIIVACSAATVGAVNSALESAAPVPSNSAVEDESAPADEPSKPASEPRAAAAKIGENVKAGDWQFKVTDFECGKKAVGNEYLNKKAQGQFCFLKITAKNNSDTEGKVSGDSQKLSDDDGKTYSSDLEASLYEDPDSALFYEGVNPGNTAKGTVIFDVPKGVKITSVSLTGGGIFDGSAKVSLK